MKPINDHPLFSWAACSNLASGIAKVCIANESFWLKDCASVGGNIIIGTVDNSPCATHLHGLHLGDKIYFIVNNPRQKETDQVMDGAPSFRPNSMSNEGAASLAFTQCRLMLPNGTVIIVNLHYVAEAYLRGADQYPANLVQFTLEQSAEIAATLEAGEDTDFIAECINCAIAEGDCTAGTISSCEEDPTKEIKWTLLA